MTIDEACNELTNDRTPRGVLAVVASAEPAEQLTTAPEISPACSGAACVDCPGVDLFGKSCRHGCHSVGRREPRDVWGDAHTHAVSAGWPDPEQFANDYTSMLEDSQYENRYPDVPLPTPAEFIWP